MNERESYRQILRATWVTAGAAALNILIGLVKVKVAAVLLGPAGVGLIGLMQSLMTTAASIASLGLGTVGTRQIAEAAGRKCPDDVANARRVLSWGSIWLASLGGVLLWLLRDPLAEHVLRDRGMAASVGWLAVGVAMTIAAAAQGAALNGLRRLRDMARLNVVSALLSTALGVAILARWGERAIPAFVLAMPLASLVVGRWYTAKLPPVGLRIPIHILAVELRRLAVTGVPFMLSGAVVTASELVVRTLIHRQLGAEALGYFQAAWIIAITYTVFVLWAMGADYYPRLAALMRDHAAANRLVNQQTEVALLLAGPVLIAMVGCAPLVIELLYSTAFRESTSVLRWLILGDVLKIASWPLGYMFLAAGDGRTFLVTETVSNLVFVSATWIMLPLVGLHSPGVAFIAMHLTWLLMVFVLVRRRTGIRWEPAVTCIVVILLALCVGVSLLAQVNEWIAATASLFISSGLAVLGIARLSGMAEVDGPFGRLARRLPGVAPRQPADDDNQ